MLNLEMNTWLNSLVIFIMGIKYCGALHLLLCVSNAFLQIPACRQAGYAALTLNIRTRMCRASNYIQMNNCSEDRRCGAP
jgi:hypothetical protein